MQKGMKIAIALVALALAVVVALIVIVRMPGSKPAVQILTETAQPPTAEPTPETKEEPTLEIEEGPTPGIGEELTQAADKAAGDEADSSIIMYEGALAGLTEEEIAALALSEESGHVEVDLEEGID